MTQKEYNAFIKKSLKDLPLHKQEEILDKMQYKWAPELYEEILKKIKTQKFLKCRKCGRYSKEKDYSVKVEKELVKNQLVSSHISHIDCYHEYADVLYEVEYLVCPLCKKKNQRLRNKISEKNRRREYG